MANATNVTGTEDDAQLLMLLDGSGSMEDPDAVGDPKIDGARAAVTEVIDSLDADHRVGLRIFGGHVPLDQPRADKCSDSQLVVPVGSGNTAALRAAVDDYSPLGETPIGYALQQAAADLGASGKRTILLVSDGIATCDPDPCEVAEELTVDGLDLVVHTVGLGVDDATRSQLRCIADAAGGSYYDAADTQTLTTALTRISSRAFRPFAIEGTPVRGSTDPALAPVLSAGQYTDTIGVVDQDKWYTVTRSSPGTGVHVGIAAQPAFGTTAMMDIRLETLDGQRCGSQRTFASTALAGVSVLSGAAQVPSSGPDLSKDGACQTDDHLRLALMPVPNYGSEGTPLEIVIIETPAFAEGPLPEMPPLAEFISMERGTAPVPVEPGLSFNDAAPLTSGETYELDVMPGEVLFFTVPVDFGQAAQVRLDYDPEEFPHQTRDILGQRYGGPFFNLDYLRPDRGEILNLVHGSRLSGTSSSNQRLHLTESEPGSAVASTGQVRPSNRGRAGLGRDPFFSGDHYLMLSLTPSSQSYTVPVTLTVEVVGEAVPGPALAEVDQSESDASVDAEADGDVASESEDATTEPLDTGSDSDETEDASSADEDLAIPTVAGDGDDNSALIWILGGAGVLLATAGAVLLSRGRATRHL